MESSPRVALFPDSYLEINGTAMTCRRLVEYAAGCGYALLCVHAGDPPYESTTGGVTHMSLTRSRVSISMDDGLAFDPVFLRHYRTVVERLAEFRPDVVHITGINDMSILGILAARKLEIPVLASWHTNLHQFAARRVERSLWLMPAAISRAIGSITDRAILRGLLLYYRIPNLILAPNQELIEMLSLKTGRETRLMGRGVDTTFFAPARRTVDDEVFRFGFVGRLRAEKDLDALIDLEQDLLSAGLRGFEFLIVGDGSERQRLEHEMKTAKFTGYLEGPALAAAYANMDAFVFPSGSDAYGNVVHEANSSGVPVIVSAEGGPKFLIDHGINGFVAKSRADFLKYASRLLDDRNLLGSMRSSSRDRALALSWDAVFTEVYDAYRNCAGGGRKIGNGPPHDRTLDKADHSDAIRVTKRLIRSPVRNILMKWNWKSALLSASIRSPLFFTVYLQEKHGLTLALGAMAVQFALRTALGGVNGTIIQAYSRAEPAWHVMITIPLALAAISHLFEVVVQTTYSAATGTSGGGRAVLYSVMLSVASAVFNLFAMRRGVLIVRDERQRPFWRDLARMPWIAAEFITFPIFWAWTRARRRNVAST